MFSFPAMKDDYGAVAKINQELDLTSALTLYFVPLSVPLIVKLIKHARWWLSFFYCLLYSDVSRLFLVPKMATQELNVFIHTSGYKSTW